MRFWRYASYFPDCDGDPAAIWEYSCTLETWHDVLLEARDDFWAASLRSLGAKLGKLVYVMDAALDMEDDRASGSYNPLVALDVQPQDVREDLELLAADAAAAFERLPLERDARVLRSVLYAGVWQKYYAKDAKRTKQAKGTTHVQEEHQEAHRG